MIVCPSVRYCGTLWSDTGTVRACVGIQYRVSEWFTVLAWSDLWVEFTRSQVNSLPGILTVSVLSILFLSPSPTAVAERHRSTTIMLWRCYCWCWWWWWGRHTHCYLYAPTRLWIQSENEMMWIVLLIFFIPRINRTRFLVSSQSIFDQFDISPNSNQRRPLPLAPSSDYRNQSFGVIKSKYSRSLLLALVPRPIFNQRVCDFAK